MVRLLKLSLLGLIIISSSITVHALDNVQVGKKFGRRFVSNSLEVPSHLRMAALSTAQFGSSSGFFVGQTQGRYFFATTAHSAFKRTVDLQEQLYTNQSLCSIFPGYDDFGKREFKINLLDLSFTCLKAIVVIPEIDFALFEASIDEDVDLTAFGLSFAASNLEQNIPLTLFSYSSYNNPGFIFFDLAVTSDDDCRIISDPNKSLLIDTQHDITKEALKINSIAIGCDTVPGDSGAPVFNSLTGELIGLVWGGAFPKKVISKNLTSVINDLPPYVRSEFIRSELNYVISINEIYNHLNNKIEQLNPQDQSAVEELLN